MHKSLFSRPCLESVAQSVGSLTADPEVTSLIPAWSHTFVEIDHDIFPVIIHLIHLLIQEGYVDESTG